MEASQGTMKRRNSNVRRSARIQKIVIEEDKWGKIIIHPKLTGPPKNSQILQLIFVWWLCFLSIVCALLLALATLSATRWDQVEVKHENLLKIWAAFHWSQIIDGVLYNAVVAYESSWLLYALLRISSGLRPKSFDGLVLFIKTLNPAEKFWKLRRVKPFLIFGFFESLDLYLE